MEHVKEYCLDMSKIQHLEDIDEGVRWVEVVRVITSLSVSIAQLNVLPGECDLGV